jgi:hypothetical protein
VGLYELVIVMEAPDEETVSALLLTVGALGNVRANAPRFLGRRDEPDPRQNAANALERGDSPTADYTPVILSFVDCTKHRAKVTS